MTSSLKFNTRSNFQGTHAFLSPSKYSWINYDDEKLDRVYFSYMEAQRGTRLHQLAHDLIREGIKLPDNGQTLSLYVNDAIGFRMTPEQLLFYSDNCYGHADCISFNTAQRFLRVHDLKNGVTPASVQQLLVYVALFCLEYKFKPFQIGMEVRIYQSDEVKVYEPDPDDIFHIMDKIVTFDKRINAIRQEVFS